MEKEKLQRYSIRKLSVGAASVLIGIGFAGLANSNQVNAATVEGNKPQAQVVQQQDNQPTTSSETQQATSATQNRDASQQDASKRQNSSVLEASNTQQVNHTQDAQKASQVNISSSDRGGYDQLKAKQVGQENVSSNTQKVQTSTVENQNQKQVVDNKNKVETTTLNLNSKQNFKAARFSFAESKAATDWTDPASHGFHKTTAGWTKQDVGDGKAIGVAEQADLKILADGTNDKVEKNQNKTIFDSWGYGVSLDGKLRKQDLQHGKQILIGTIAVINQDNRYIPVGGEENDAANADIVVSDSDGTSFVLGNIYLSPKSYNDNTLEQDYLVNITANNDQLNNIADDVKFHMDIKHSFSVDNWSNQYKGLRGTTPENPFHNKWVVPNNDGSDYDYDLQINWDGQTVANTSEIGNFNGKDVELYYDGYRNYVVAYDFHQNDPNQTNNFKTVYKLTLDEIDNTGNKTGKSAILSKSNNLDFAVTGMPKFVTKDGKIIEQNYGFMGEPKPSSINIVKDSDGVDANSLLQATPNNSIHYSYDLASNSVLIAYNIDPKLLKTDKQTIEDEVDNSFLYNIGDVTKYGFANAEDFKQTQLDYYANRDYILPDAALWVISVDRDKNNPYHYELTDLSTMKTYQGTYTPNGSQIDTSFWRTANIHYLNKDNGKTVANDTASGANSKTSTITFKEPAGYSFAPGQAGSEDYLFKDSDNEINVYVVAKNQNIPVQYVDDDANAKVVATDSVNGKTDETYNYVVAKVPTNYELATGQSNNVNGTVKPINQAILIHVKHKTEPVTQSRNIVETIDYLDESGKKLVASQHQSATVNWRGTKDLVTNTQKGQWSTAQFAAVDSPIVKGYTPNIATVEAVTVTDGSPSITKTVKYKANDETATITYYDDTDHKALANPKTVSGKFGQKINFGDVTSEIENYQKQHYNFVDSDFTNQTFADDPQLNNYVVHFTHATRTSSPDDTNGDPDAKNYYHDVKRNIKYQYEDGSQASPDVNDSLHFTDTKTIDLVNGKVLNELWSKNQDFKDVATPNKTGYIPTIAVVSNKNVSHSTPDIYVTVTYKAKDEKALINYIDDTLNKILFTDNASGKYNQNMQFEQDPDKLLKDYLSKGYDLVSNSYKPGKFQDGIANNTFAIHLKHHISNVTDPKLLNATFDRTVIEHQPDGKDKRLTQHYVIKRTGTQDQVTKAYTFSNWSSAAVHEDNGDVFDGYTAVIAKATPAEVATIVNGEPVIKAETFTNPNNNAVNPVNRSETVEIAYNANNQKVTVTYIDDDAKANGSDPVLQIKNLIGKSNTNSGYDTKDQIAAYLKQGYDLVSDDTQGKQIVYDSKDKTDQAYAVHLKHHISDVNDSRILTATFDRVITEHLPEGQDKQITQHYVITRDGKQDQVTKEYTFGNWSVVNVHDDKIDDLPGYTAHVKSSSPSDFISLVNGKSVAKAEKFTNENGKLLPQNRIEKAEIEYTVNPQSAAIVYIDDTADKVLQKVMVEGHYGEAIDFTPAVSSIIDGFTKKGYVLVSNDFNGQKYDSDNDKNIFAVHLKHGTLDTSRSKSISETIHYVYDDGTKAHDDYVVTKTFTNHGVKDLVTGEVTWDKSWTPDNVQFDQVTSPDIPGYTPDKANIPVQNINAESKNLEFKVTYTKTSEYVPNDVVPEQPQADTNNQVRQPDVSEQPNTNNDSADNKPATKVKKISTKHGAKTDFGKESTVAKLSDSAVAKKQKTNYPAITTVKISEGNNKPVKVIKVQPSSEKLPKTGEKEDSSLAALGLAAVSLGSLFGLGLKKKEN